MHMEQLLVGYFKECANMLGNAIVKMCVDTAEGELLLALLQYFLKVMVSLEDKTCIRWMN